MCRKNHSPGKCGRPSKNNEKIRRFSMGLTEAQLDKIRIIAAKRGMPVNRLLRMIVLEGLNVDY